MSFLKEYGSKLKEGYVAVKHLSNIQRSDSGIGCYICPWFDCCNNNWQKVWQTKLFLAVITRITFSCLNAELVCSYIYVS